MSGHLSKLTLFKNLSSEEMEQVNRAAIERCYPKGTTIFFEEEESDGFYIIVSGLVKIIKLHPDGREITLDLIREDEVLGEMTIVGSNLRSATAIVVKPTEMIAFPGKSFQRLMSDMPVLATNIIEILSGRLRNANSQIEALSFLNARSRVIYNLIHLAREQGTAGEGKTVIIPRLSQSEMANLCGVSRQVVNKVLTELRSSRFIEVAQKHVQILDLDGLRQLLLM
jgi:CRP/FNR family transcriptional regulator